MRAPTDVLATLVRQREPESPLIHHRPYSFRTRRQADTRWTVADLAVYCWLRVHQLVHDNGVTGIVGPDSLLTCGRPSLGGPSRSAASGPPVPACALATRRHQRRPLHAAQLIPRPGAWASPGLRPSAAAAASKHL